MHALRAVSIVSVLSILLFQPIVARATVTPLRLSYGDLGVLQLAAHDLFRVDRTLEVNLENGKLDLSTIFDHGAEKIAKGGEIRNSENIMVFTAAKRYATEYQRLVAMKVLPASARTIAIAKFKGDLTFAYTHLLLGEGLPPAAAGEVTMTEDLALRVIHDLVPGTLRISGRTVPVFDPSLKGIVLSSSDQKNLGAPLDGQFDPALLNIVVVVPPLVFNINLLALDSSFASQFGTDFTFEHFLGEAADGRLNKTENVTGYIRSLFAKAFAN